VVIRDFDDKEHLVRARQGQRVEIVPGSDERQVRLGLGVLPVDDGVLNGDNGAARHCLHEQHVGTGNDGRVPAPNRCHGDDLSLDQLQPALDREDAGFAMR
jgi:hypothetical protein